MTDAELRGLLVDCLHLWGVPGRVTAGEGGLSVIVADGAYELRRAPEEMRPVRWLLQTPARASAGRSPRVAQSIVALLSALRNAVGGEGGRAARVGPG